MLCRYFGVSFLYILRIRMVSLGYLYLDEVVIQDKNMDKVYEFNSWSLKPKKENFWQRIEGTLLLQFLQSSNNFLIITTRIIKTWHRRNI